MTMLEQTKSAYAAMHAAGFRRGEFRAYAETHRRRVGSRIITEYGPCLIWVKRLMRGVELTAAMRAQGLSVEYMCLEGKLVSISVDDDGHGAFRIINFVGTEKEVHVDREEVQRCICA